jgi:hypothetical protein
MWKEDMEVQHSPKTEVEKVKLAMKELIEAADEVKDMQKE